MTEHKCNLVIDTCCDLPWDFVKESGVDSLQFPFQMSDGTHLDDYGQAMTHEQFYKLMQEGEQPMTAQIPYATLLEKFEQVAKSGVPTVFLCFTSGLSGTFDTILTMSEEMKEKYPESQIYVVDSLLASIAEGFLAYEAIRMWNSGMSAPELVAWIEEARWFVNASFTVGSLDSLSRGGRIPQAVAAIGGKLEIKPILAFDLEGHLSMDGICKGRKKSLRAVAKFINETCLETDSPLIFTGNSISEDEVEAVRNMITLPNPRFVNCKIGPVIGSHVGPGMVAAVCWGPDRRKDGAKSNDYARQIREGIVPAE